MKRLLLVLLVLPVMACVDHAAARIRTAQQTGLAGVAKETCLDIAKKQWDITDKPAAQIIADLKQCDSMADTVWGKMDGGVQ